MTRSRRVFEGVLAKCGNVTGVMLYEACYGQALSFQRPDFSLPLLMANDVAPVVDSNHSDFVFLIHYRDRHW
jgi:hypothetical protein